MKSMNQGLLFIGLGGSAGARISLKSNWAGAAEICRFIFIGGWGGEASAPSLAAAPEVFSYLTFKGWLAFLAEGKLLLNHFIILKSVWADPSFENIEAQWLALRSVGGGGGGTGHLQPHTAPGSPVSQFIRKMGRTINTAEKYFFICSY